MTDTTSAATAAGEGEASAAVAVTTYHAPYPEGYLHGPECLTQRQREILLRGINTNRVSKLDKGRGPALSYVEAYDVRAHLTRVFGFANWSEDILEVERTFEDNERRSKKDKTGKPIPDTEYTAWTVGYRATVRLTVNCPHGVPIASYTEVAADVSDAQPGRGDAHHNALTSAASTALKRAAANLGDQFGLSLYRKGSSAPLVVDTLVAPPAPPTDNLQGRAKQPDAHIQAPLPREEDASRESVSVPYEGDDYATAQATEEPAADGAPRGPKQIQQDALDARDLPPQERLQRVVDLTTELAKVGGDLTVKTMLIGEAALARQALDRAARAEEYAEAQP